MRLPAPRECGNILEAHGERSPSPRAGPRLPRRGPSLKVLSPCWWHPCSGWGELGAPSRAPPPREAAATGQREQGRNPAEPLPARESPQRRQTPCSPTKYQVGGQRAVTLRPLSGPQRRGQTAALRGASRSMGVRGPGQVRPSRPRPSPQVSWARGRPAPGRPPAALPAPPPAHRRARSACRGYRQCRRPGAAAQALPRAPCLTGLENRRTSGTGTPRGTRGSK